LSKSKQLVLSVLKIFIQKLIQHYKKKNTKKEFYSTVTSIGVLKNVFLQFSYSVLH